MTAAGRVQRWIDKGCDLADNGDHKGAVRLYGQAVAAGEKWVGLNLGNSYEALGDHERAAEAYRLAWRGGGEDDAGYNLTNVLEEVGQEIDEDVEARNLVEWARIHGSTPDDPSAVSHLLARIGEEPEEVFVEDTVVALLEALDLPVPDEWAS